VYVSLKYNKNNFFTSQIYFKSERKVIGHKIGKKLHSTLDVRITFISSNMLHLTQILEHLQQEYSKKIINGKIYFKTTHSLTFCCCVKWCWECATHASFFTTLTQKFPICLLHLNSLLLSLEEISLNFFSSPKMLRTSMP